MKIEFSNHRYIASHGKPPRGRGWWIFETAGGHQFQVAGDKTLSEAKEAVKREIREAFHNRTHVTVYVAP